MKERESESGRSLFWS